jgi:uncharacterized protein YbjT (DUF2867 family)
VILVTGAAGLTGQAVVRALAAAGERVRAFDVRAAVAHLTRDDDDQAGEWIQPFVGDMCDSDQVRDAMSGIRTVVHIGPPMHRREAEMGRIVVSEARLAGVEHFVLFSVTHPQLDRMLNHQAKLDVERHLLLSRLPFTILQPTYYMQNIDVEATVRTGVLRQPFAVDTRLAHVDLVNVADITAQVVTRGESHHYATYELCGSDHRSGREVAEVIAAESGRTVEVEAVTMTVGSEAGPGSSEDEDYFVDSLLRILDHYERYGLTGNRNVLTWLLGRRPTSFAEYVRRCLAHDRTHHAA